MKTISYATLHFSVAFTVTWCLTGDAFIGGMVALIEPAINTVAYFFHEKFWARAQEKKRKANIEDFGLNNQTSAMCGRFKSNAPTGVNYIA